MSRLYSKEVLTGQDGGGYSGSAISVSGSSSNEATEIHQSGRNVDYSEDTSAIDEMWLYAHNAHTSNRILVISWGMTSGSYDPNTGLPLYTTIPPQSGLTLVVPGLILSSGSKAMAWDGSMTEEDDNTGSLEIFGYINRSVNVAE